MKTLSQVLDGSSLLTLGAANSDTASTPQRGLTLTDGQTNTLPVRDNPLTVEQITALRSFARPLMPTVCWQENFETVRGEDEAGEYVERKPIGLVPVITCHGQVDGNREDAIKLLLSALRLGSDKSVRQSITRLAAHKFLAKNQSQLTLLLADYTTDLAEFPEFVITTVCDFYRRENVSKFMPTVAEMRKVCADLRFALLREHTRLSMPPREEVKPLPPPRDRRDIPKAKWTQQDWQDYVDEPARMAAMWKEHGEIERAKDWVEIVRGRIMEFDSEARGFKIVDSEVAKWVL